MPRWIAVLALAGCGHAAPVEPTLRQQTQALLDAVSTGNARTWDLYLDRDMTYVAEDGTIETKSSLLPQIVPLPAGISGSLTIATFAVRVFGDTAVVVHEDHERESFFGVAITADYLTTDTWRRLRDGWRLVARQVHALNQDPPAVTLPAAELDAYVGTYHLTPSVAYTIVRDGDHLVGQRAGGKAQVLAAELRDVLFIRGQPRSRKIFLRDERGAITGFVDRREGRDIRWTRDR